VPVGFLNNFSPLVIGFKTTMTLFRTFLNGALAIAGITAAFGFATEAQAASFNLPDSFEGNVGQLNGGLSVQVGDKLFSDFVIPTGTGLFQATDAVNVVDNEPGFEIKFNPFGGGSNNLSVGGTLSYKVTVVNPFINVFETFQTQTTASSGTRTATRNTSVSGLVPATLTTTNSGLSDLGKFPSGPKTINVSDTWSFNTTGTRNITLLQAFIDQDPDEPTVPEPSAVLGLLALGLCGTLVGRQKKG